MSIKVNKKATVEYIGKTLTKKDVSEGFAIRELDPLANMATNEHNTTFYDEVERDGVTGFVERGNFLDRL